MDLYLFHLINKFALKSFLLDAFGIFCAKYLGYVLVLILFLLLVVNFKKYWRMVTATIISGILSRGVFVEIIRWLFPKDRPFIGDNNVNLLFKDMDHIHHSFPSGHAAFFFAISTIVYFYNKKLGTFFLISSLLICIGRVFVGVHWPADVTVGAAVGIISAWITLIFRDLFWKEKIIKK